VPERRRASGAAARRRQDAASGILRAMHPHLERLPPEPELLDDLLAGMMALRCFRRLPARVGDTGRMPRWTRQARECAAMGPGKLQLGV
jgi:hypothetical protein